MLEYVDTIIQGGIYIRFHDGTLMCIGMHSGATPKISVDREEENTQTISVYIDDERVSWFIVVERQDECTEISDIGEAATLSSSPLDVFYADADRVIHEYAVRDDIRFAIPASELRQVLACLEKHGESGLARALAYSAMNSVLYLDDVDQGAQVLLKASTAQHD